MGDPLSSREIESRIRTYFGGEEKDRDNRYRSWEYCYGYFRQLTPSRLAKHRHDAANWLGFYLASWGMYRASSFLFNRAYTVHLKAIDCLADPRWSWLWRNEFGANDGDEERIDDVVQLGDCLWETYAPSEPTATLVTKILLGTLGCCPALDTYFNAGFRDWFPANNFNKGFVTNALGFCRENVSGLRRAQSMVEKDVGTRYPLMKLVDMYFWQVGYEKLSP